MKLIKLTCPNCNANLDLDSEREFGFCQYCGTKIAIQKEVPHTQTNIEQVIINNGVIINRNNDKDKIENLLLRAEDFFNSSDTSKASKYYNKVLDIDAKNEKAKIGLKNTQIKELLIKAQTMHNKNAIDIAAKLYNQV